MTAPVRIVLVDTSHPGNIGAAARAMKNMQLDELVLVRPKAFPHTEATSRASGAADVLERARVVATVAEAIAVCGLVLGCTARPRSASWRVLEPREAAAEALGSAGERPAALLFGGEQNGLSNEDMACCHALVCIPTGPDYASLNLAQAVQILSYELWLARRAPPPQGLPQPASGREMGHLYAHLDRVMQRVGFMHAQNERQLREQLERLLSRARPESREVQILRGLLTAIERHRGGQG